MKIFHFVLKPLAVCGLLPTVILSISSCCKPIIAYESYFTNNTEQHIELKFFKKGTEENLLIMKLSTTKLDSPFFMGDSILVFKNEILSEVHYPQNSSSSFSNSKVVRASDPGSLFNGSSYVETKKELSCGGSITKFTYIFNK